MTTRRLDLAILRVLAICAVVTIHVTGLTTTNADLRGTTVWWVAEVLNLGSRFCVPLFVMVSGALLLRPVTSETAAQFYRRRMSRLIPPLLFWYATYTLFSRLVLGTDKGALEVLGLVLSGRTYTALYFFWLILGLYVITPALRKLLDGVEPSQLVTLGVLLTAATCLWQTLALFINSYTEVDATSTPNALSYWIPYVGYFVLGAGLARVTLQSRAALPASVVLVASTALTVWVDSGEGPVALRTIASDSYQGWGVALSSAALFVLVCALCGHRPASGSTPGRAHRLLDTLGGATLGVFAGHLLILYALQHADVLRVGSLTVAHGASHLSELGFLLVVTTVLSFAFAVAGSKVVGVRRLV